MSLMEATAVIRRAGNVQREKDDFYRTPPQCAHDLLDRESISGGIWEPACGDGAISSVLESRGHRVLSTDLVDRGYGEPRRDFLLEQDLLAPNIITNPPFKLADQFILHSLALGAQKVCMFLRLAFLEGRARHTKLFMPHPPARVHVYSGRQTLWMGGHERANEPRGGAIAFAWFVWDAAHSGAPELRWIA